MIHIPNLSSVCASSSSSSSSSADFHSSRTNDFELYDGMDFPVGEDDVVNDSIGGSYKAIAFAAPTPLAMYVGSGAVPLSVRLDQPYEPKLKQTDSSKSKRSVYDYAISREHVEESEVRSHPAPDRPLVLLPGTINSELSVGELVRLFKKLFDDELTDVSYEFSPYDCCFSGVFARGSRYSDFRLRIYQNTDVDAGGHIIEMQRLHKESCVFAFKGIFEAVKKALDGDASTSDMTASGEFDFSSNEFGDSDQPSDEEVELSLKQVIVMAAESNDQSLLEACRLLCDFADQPELRQRMADAGCVRVLVDAMQSERMLVRQHAMLALAQLSECSECINAILDCAGMNVIMSLSCDGPYYTAAMRKESARALANIASKKAAEVVEQVGPEFLATWSTQIHELNDATIRERAERANSYLQAVASL